MSEKAIKPKSVKVNYAYNLAYEIFVLLTPLITTPYISRVLGPSGVGVYSFTHSLVQYFLVFGNLGVATYGQMAIAAARDDREKVSTIFYELWILRFCTLLLSLVAYLFFSMHSGLYREERLLQSILILAAMFDLTWLLRGVEDFSKVVLRNVAIKLMMIAMIFAFVKTRDDVNVYILLMAVATLLGNLTFLFTLRGILTRVDPRKLDPLQHLPQCIVYFIPTIATSVYKLIDKSMLGFLLEGTSENGFYEQAHRIEEILVVVITSLNTIMRSRMSFLYRQNRLEEMRRRLEQSLSFILLISIAMCMGLIGIAKTFVPLFLGSEFDRSIVLLQIFSVLIVLIGLSNCLNTHYLAPSGRQGKNNVILIFGAILNFILNYLSIPRYGALGAAAASVIAEAVILIGYLYQSRDFLQARELLRLGWRYLAAGAVMLLCVAALERLPYSPVAVLAIQVAAGAVVYFGMVFLLRDPFVKQHARSALQMLLRKMKRNGEKA